MDANDKNATPDEGARKSLTKSSKVKMHLGQPVLGKSVRCQVLAQSTVTSSKPIIPRYINWHESEWPDLPKPSSSQHETKYQESRQHLASHSLSQCETLKQQDENSVQTEVLLSFDSHILLENHFTYTGTSSTRGIDDITSSLTELKMSNKCHQIPAGNAQSHLTFLKRLSQNQKIDKKMKGQAVENHSCTMVNQEALLSGGSNDHLTLLDDEFPNLLTKTSLKKVKKKYAPIVDDFSVKKLTKKYPRRNDPIFINLGDVIEHSTSTENCKTILRNRYSRERDFRPGNARRDTSRRIIKRGKQREFPKRKTLTKIKVAILRDRELRVKSRLADTSDKISGKPASDQPSFIHCPNTNQPGTSASEAEETGSGIASSEKKVGSTQTKCPLIERSCASEVSRLSKSPIHSRKFREYCNNDKCANLDEKVKAFVKLVYRFQSKSHFRDADKARIHKRYALGLREADKYFKLRKIKVLLVATDLEANFEKDGLGEIIENMKSRACKENLPVIFALKRRDLAYCVYRKVPVSCMAVLNYEGAEELYRAMIDAWKEASAAYQAKLTEIQDLNNALNEDPNGEWNLNQMT